jgi:hypothetical protein
MAAGIFRRMNNYADEIADKLDRFTGVEVVGDFTENFIKITCESQIVLMFLADWLVRTHGSLEVLPAPNHFVVNIYAETKKDFEEMIRWLDKIQQDNKCVLKDTKYPILPTDREYVNAIEAFDRKSKNKYAKFIAYLRKKRIEEDGMPVDMALLMTAPAMIDSYFCGPECGDHICSREEVTRMVMESESPERAIEMIGEIISEHLHKEN